MTTVPAQLHKNAHPIPLRWYIYYLRTLRNTRTPPLLILTSSLTGAFCLLVLLSAYVSVTPPKIPQVNDKILHFLIFFLLTVTFYWILDTTRRRTFNLTLVLITFCLGLGSEVVQALLPKDRTFDPLDIAANLVGSLSALGLCTLYHKRMLDRRRAKKGYGVIPQDGEERDLELGEGVSSRQESGVIEEQDEVWDDMGGDESGDGDGLTPSSTEVGEDVGSVKK